MLRGRVCFQVDGTTIEARTGDSVVVPEGGLHDFENPSPDRVYLITIVSSDHGFADRLRHGIPTPSMPRIWRCCGVSESLADVPWCNPGLRRCSRDQPRSRVLPFDCL